jgi:hypothetical protein
MTYDSTPVQDWSGLTAGNEVTVTEPGRGSFSARVETKTADSAVVWVIGYGGQRRAFDHREDVKVVVLPEPAVIG